MPQMSCRDGQHCLRSELPKRARLSVDAEPVAVLNGLFYQRVRYILRIRSDGYVKTVLDAASSIWETEDCSLLESCREVTRQDNRLP